MCHVVVNVSMTGMQVLSWGLAGALHLAEWQGRAADGDREGASQLRAPAERAAGHPGLQGLPQLGGPRQPLQRGMLTPSRLHILNLC